MRFCVRPQHVSVVTVATTEQYCQRGTVRRTVLGTARLLGTRFGVSVLFTYKTMFSMDVLFFFVFIVFLFGFYYVTCFFCRNVCASGLP